MAGEDGEGREGQRRRVAEVAAIVSFCAHNQPREGAVECGDQPPFALHPYTGTLVKQELSRSRVVLESEG